MSMIFCNECRALIDSDDDPDCFAEVGNMRRLHETKILCEPCRERRIEELAADADPCTEDARRGGCTCTMRYANPTDIDPPEPKIDCDCPLHGGADPDELRQRKMDRAADQ